MKKRYLLISVAALCIAGGALAMSHQYQTSLKQYIEQDMGVDQITDIVRSLGVAQYNDIPGFSGALGDTDKVRDLIDRAHDQEAEAYQAINSLWAKLPVNATLASCAREMHTIKIQALDALGQLAGTRLMPTSQVDDAIKPSLAYLDKHGSCQTLLRLKEMPVFKTTDKNTTDGKAQPKQAQSSSLPAPQPAKSAERGLRERFRDMLINFTGGDPEAADRMVALLIRPKTLDDWRFLAELDQAWSERDCGNAAFCFAQMDILARAERQLQKTTPPSEAEMEFLLLKSYDTGKEMEN